MRRDAINPALLATSSSAITDDREILPKNVKPLHYSLSMEPDLNGGTYEGTVSINLEALEETSSISLNLKDTKVTSSSILVSSKLIGNEDLSTTYDAKAQVFTITLAKSDTISAGTKFVLAMVFEGSLDKGSSGFFRSSFKDPTTGQLKWVGSTQLEPVDARKAFPCFDEPALKATFQVTLIAAHHLTCLGNMPITLQSDMYSPTTKSIKKAVTFNSTPLMSTYLVCFAIGEFNMIETNEWRIPIRIYAPIDEPIEKARFALDISARSMKLHEETFGVKYPLPKLDQIQTPGNKGGMENWGLVTYQPGLLIYDEETGGSRAKQATVSVILHELAHQWFGDIVTMEFWDGVWLNESFASWAQSYNQDRMFPEWETTQDFLTTSYQMALELDSNRGSHPIQVPVKRADEINQVFDNISYMKGESILRMLVDYIGVKGFLSGVRNYLNKHAFGNSVTADLWKELEDVSKLEVGSFMAEWTQKVGYPVISITEDSSVPDHIQIVQHRFLKSGKPTPEEDETEWFIPLNIRTKSGITSTEFSSRKETFRVPNDFYKLNANQTGFYRVAYPPIRLIKLGEAALNGLLSVEDRIGIISDATALAASGFYSTPTVAVLGLFSSFSSEENYFVWRQLLSSLKLIIRAWLSDEDRNALLSFQKQLTQSCLKRVGLDFSNIKEKSDNEILFQALIFGGAGEADNEDVVSAAKSMFKKWMNGDDNAIPTDVRDAVFMLVIRHGTDKEFSYLLNLLISPPAPSPSLPPRFTLLSALGHTQNPSHISQILNLWMNSSYQDSGNYRRALQSMALYPQSASMVWEFTKANYKVLIEKESNGILQRAGFMMVVLAGLSTFEHVEDVKGFFYGEKRDLDGFDIVLKQLIDDMETKAKWVERDGEEVGKWLGENGYDYAGV